MNDPPYRGIFNSMILSRTRHILGWLLLKKNRKYIASGVLLSAIVVSAGIFSFANFVGAENEATAQNIAWTESAGLGVSVPACASGSMSTSCSGLQGALTLNVYNLHGGAAFVYADFWGGPLIWTSGYGGENYTVTLTGLDSNRTYCAGANDPFGGQYGVECKSTPNCLPLPLPVSDIRANDVSGSITIPINTAAQISWCGPQPGTPCLNATSCSVFEGETILGVNPVCPSGDPPISRNWNNGSVWFSCGLQPPQSCPVTGGWGAYPSFVLGSTYNCSGPTVPCSQGLVNAAIDGGFANPGWTAAVCSGSSTIWSGTSGSYSTGNLSTSTPYTLTCSGPGGTSNDNVTVNVSGGASSAPTCSASFSPSAVNYGETSQLTWNQTDDADGIVPYSCTGNLGSATNTPVSPFTTGPITNTQTCTLTVQSGSGVSTCQATVNVNTATLGVVLTSNPIGGQAPLTVNLTASTTGSATGPVDYRFDCTNDGSYEVFSLGNPLSAYTALNACTYSTPGSYTARVRVDRGGLIRMDTTVINVTALPSPTLGVALTASPSSGSAPLASTLSATVSGSATGNIRYRFDCTNDGVPDQDVTTTTNPGTFICNYPLAGFYTARVVVDREGVSTTDAVAIAVNTASSSLPNLFANPIFRSGALVPGGTLTFTTSVTNFGSSTAGASTGRYCLDVSEASCLSSATGELSTVAIGALNPSQTFAIFTQNWTATLGSHTVVFCADVFDVVVESFEGAASNCATNAFTVSVLPDLSANAISRSGILEDGETLTFTTTVTNAGGGIAGASTGRYCLDVSEASCLSSATGQLSTPAIGALNPSQTSAIFTQNWTATLGSHTVVFCADVFNVVAESFEDAASNCATNAFTVGAGPLPVIVVFKATPAGITKGQDSRLDWNVSNCTSPGCSCSALAVAPTTQWDASTVIALPSGSAPVSPPATTYYTLTCTNLFGSASGTTAVTVGVIEETGP